MKNIENCLLGTGAHIWIDKLKVKSAKITDNYDLFYFLISLFDMQGLSTSPWFW